MNPNTKEPIEPADYEPRGQTVIGVAPSPDVDPQPPIVAPTEAEHAEWCGLNQGQLALCLEHGVSPKFVRRLIDDREAARVAGAGIDYVLAMIGIE